MKYLIILIGLVWAGTANAHERCTWVNNLAWLPMVQCDTSDDRGERRSFERRVPSKPDMPDKPDKPKPPKEKDRHDHGKGDHTAGKGKGHEKGGHRE